MYPVHTLPALIFQDLDLGAHYIWVWPILPNQTGFLSVDLDIILLTDGPVELNPPLVSHWNVQEDRDFYLLCLLLYSQFLKRG